MADTFLDDQIAQLQASLSKIPPGVVSVTIGNRTITYAALEKQLAMLLELKNRQSGEANGAFSSVDVYPERRT